MKKNVQLSFAVIFLILGIVSTIQYKTTKQIIAYREPEQKSIQEVQAQLLRQKEYSDNLAKQVAEYQKKVESYQKNANVSDMMKNDLENAKVLAGISDVKGKGIIITIDDSKVVNADEKISSLDLLQLINEVRASNAEAMSINDERIISSTEIRSVSTSKIRVNNKYIESPFTVNAIGNPNELQNALQMRDGIVGLLVKSGINLTIKQDNNIFIPKYKGAIDYKYINK